MKTNLRRVQLMVLQIASITIVMFKNPRANTPAMHRIYDRLKLLRLMYDDHLYHYNKPFRIKRK